MAIFSYELFDLSAVGSLSIIKISPRGEVMFEYKYPEIIEGCQVEFYPHENIIHIGIHKFLGDFISRNVDYLRIIDTKQELKKDTLVRDITSCKIFPNPSTGLVKVQHNLKEPVIVKYFNPLGAYEALTPFQPNLELTLPKGYGFIEISNDTQRSVCPALVE